MRRTCWVVLAAAVAAAGGCGGPPAAAVQGTVIYGGKLIATGSILFVPEDAGGKLVGGAIVDGTYRIPVEKGARPGRYKVQIEALVQTGKTVESKDDVGTELPVLKEGIPSRYNTATELTAELAAGPNTLDFDLKALPADPTPVGAEPLKPGGP